MLFEPERRFPGLPPDGFRAFEIPDREARRRAIIDAFHPALDVLAEDVRASLVKEGDPVLHSYLPRLDWPKGYQPFCTWLALSRREQGYQAGPQLNVGVHPDHVAVRLGWDTSADAFGRFEFLCRFGDLGRGLDDAVASASLAFRVYAAAPWPEGSRLVYRSADDVDGAFERVRRDGVWFEVGRRHEIPDELDRVTSPALGEEVLEVFRVLLPLLDRIERSS